MVLAIWSLLLFGGQALPFFLPTPLWHGHEMIFGFGGAALWGFVLTAAPVWTKTQPVTGMSLGLLALLFIFERVGLLLAPSGVGMALLGLGACAWFVALFWLARPIFQKKSQRNYGVVAVLLILGICNALLLVHLAWPQRGAEVLGSRLDAAHLLQVGLGTFTLLIVIIGGRITPLFTKNGLGIPSAVRARSRVDDLAVWSVALSLVLEIAGPNRWSGFVFLIAGALQVLRMWGWGSWRTWRVPILWILHLAYFATALGLLLRGLHLLAPEILLGSVALHAQGALAMGVFILAMMSRVSLGHTGRPLQVSPLMVLAYVLALLGAILRVLASAVQVIGSQFLLAVSAGLWTLAFALFFWVYMPLLFNVRPDGKSG
jgi:uncharacterized protein involved in response to NO